MAVVLGLVDPVLADRRLRAPVGWQGSMKPIGRAARRRSISVPQRGDLALDLVDRAAEQSWVNRKHPGTRIVLQKTNALDTINSQTATQTSAAPRNAAHRTVTSALRQCERKEPRSKLTGAQVGC